tara:strand:- start:240 stop:1082 length:843 start_codon:yes stop_codon:yes gene_type:complete
LDKPVDRSSHIANTPTSAGIVFLFIHLIYVLFNKNYELLSILPIGILGLIDDIFNINQIYRLIFQTINVFLISFLFLDFNIFSNLQFFNGFIPLTVFFVGLTLVNFINFMDGIDGLVAINMLLISLNYSLSNNMDLIYLPIVLSIFLFYNWFPAKIFMGDAGSTFLGLLLFYIIFSDNDLHSSIISLLTASALLMDSLICILRRMYYKENIFSPHKKHLYQRLHQKGMQQKQVSLIYAGATSILLLFSHTNNLIVMSICILFLIFFGFCLEKYFAIPFKT